ncbi:hypothetical protein SeMB42_g01293 [Synchytrium endobioticum]|uniref:Uncharacterized protein n=1 Tax=Synchytrium endobioticum TaxID=286115 RepID=A0A507DP16_9FUNG|nr:hypothetical protein SeMB42_g01293 [Synchytrium endobioticum]
MMMGSELKRKRKLSLRSNQYSNSVPAMSSKGRAAKEEQQHGLRRWNFRPFHSGYRNENQFDNGPTLRVSSELKHRTPSPAHRQNTKNRL